MLIYTSCYCQVALATWRRCPVTQQCEYGGSYSIDDAGSSKPLLRTRQWTRRETFSMVTRLLSTDFYGFVELVRVGRLREKVLLKASPAGHVSCYSGRWRQSIVGASKWQFGDGLYAEVLFWRASGPTDRRWIVLTCLESCCLYLTVLCWVFGTEIIIHLE
jgi:hypothetical protein